MHICANFFTTDSLGGALLALASGKAERRQVHPLKLAASVSIRAICGRTSPASGSVSSVDSVGEHPKQKVL